MIQIIETPTHHKTTALIIGNSQGLEWYLAQELLSKGLEIDVVTKHQPKLTPDSPGNMSPTTYSHLSAIPSFDKYFYVFLLYQSHKNPKKLEKLLSIIEPHSARKMVIIINQPLKKNFESNINRVYQHLQRLITTTQDDVRVIHINDLYGPGINTNPDNFVGLLFSKLQHSQVLGIGSPNQDIFPLYIQDAITGILKATFIPNARGNIYQLGGKLISQLNFSYKVRSLLPAGWYQTQALDTVSALSPDFTSQIEVTKQLLRWQPTTLIEEAISQTLTWIRKNTIHTPPPLTSNLPEKSAQDVTELPILPNQNIVDSQLLVESVNTNPTIDTASISNPKTFNLTKLSASFAPDIPYKKTLEPNTSSTNKTPRILSKKLWFGLGLTGLIITPCIHLLVVVLSLTSSVQKLNTSLSTHNLDNSAQMAIAVGDRLNTFNGYYQRIEPVARLMLGSAQTNQINVILEISRLGVDVVSSVTNASTQLISAIKVVTDSTKDDPQLKLDNSKVQFQSAYHQLSRLESFAKDNHIKSNNVFFNKVADVTSQLLEKKSLLKGTLEYLNNYQYLLGYDRKKVYLVLLQNDAELRPTGGFIGSYALITLEKGKLLDIHVEDVYTADGQLKGHVEPPTPIKKYLGEVGWFLRDSNWDPHFPTSAGNAAWFLQKEMGQKVDGVMGLNMRVISQLLEAVGPIEIIDYNETITAQNLFEKAQYHSEINYFQGSTQKRDFLGKLATGLINKILSTPDQDWFAIGESLLTTANNKQFQLFFFDPSLQQISRDLGWAGEIINPDCSAIISDNCYVDYLAIREANVGVNKANYFVNRQLNHQVVLEDTKLTTTLTLDYQNSSPDEAWPGGRYKNYLRIYTPITTTLTAITIDNQVVTPELIDISKEHNKRVFGVLVEVPSQGNTQVKVTYRNQHLIRSNQAQAYQVYVQKQAGTGDDPYTFTFTYPQDLSLITKSSKDPKPTNPIKYLTTLATDLVYTLELTK